MARRLTGYTPLGGSARRYRNDATGEILSRRQYDNAVARTQGFANREARRRFESSRDARQWAFAIGQRDRSKFRAGGRPGDPLVWLDADLLAAARETQLRRDRLAPRVELDHRGRPHPVRHDADDPALVAPDGPLAQLLVALGHRDPDATWNVGETNARPA